MVSRPEGRSGAAVIRGSLPLAFLTGAGIWNLGGMIGLGGAEFRLPLLIGVFGFLALQGGHPEQGDERDRGPHRTTGPAALGALQRPRALLACGGEPVGGQPGRRVARRDLGNQYAVRDPLQVIAVLLVFTAAALATTHLVQVGALHLPPVPRTVLGAAAGVGIGVVAAVMGVAGGELLIPTIVLLYGVEIKIAGSLSLVVSLPTMLVAFARYSRDNSFQALGTTSLSSFL